MKGLLIKAFRAQRPGLFNRSAMENRKQLPTESLESFVWDKVALCQKVDPPMSEKAIIQVVLAGLRDPTLVAQLYAIEGLDTFDKFHSKMQMISEGMKFASQNQKEAALNVSVVSKAPEESCLPAIQGEFLSRSNFADSRRGANLDHIQCWNCESFGHFQRNCPEFEYESEQIDGDLAERNLPKK